MNDGEGGDFLRRSRNYGILSRENSPISSGEKRGCSLGETKKSHFRFKKLHPIYLRLKAFSNDININHVFPDIWFRIIQAFSRVSKRLREKCGNFVRDKNVFQGSTSSYQRNSFQSAKRSNYVSCSWLEEECFLTFTTPSNSLVLN